MIKRALLFVSVFAVVLGTPARAESLFERLFGTRQSVSTERVGGPNFPMRVPAHLQGIIREAAAETGIDPNLLAAVIYQESRFKEHAVSWRGAQGLMQLMPRTARYLGVTDPFDPEQNVRGGARYLAEMFEKFDGDLELSLAAYNAGPTAVSQRGADATEEAVHYVRVITSVYSPSQPEPWIG
ncbi:MAG: lytic transglycosylase domain-containing protein [Thermoanaerobaculia bacterium]